MIAAAALPLFGGCALGRNHQPPVRPELVLPGHYVSAADAFHRDDPTPHLATWWETFDDPVLTGLVARALAENLDIARAVARLEQARESLVRSRADFLPGLDASARGGRNFGGGFADANSFSAGLDARWTIDLFGGIASEVRASRADLAAAGFDAAAVRTAVAAEVARNYIDARAFGVRLAIARDTLRTQDDNLEIAGFRVRAGLVTSLDVEQARVQRAQTAALIPTLVTALAAARHRLAVLTGDVPGAVDSLFAQDARIPEGPAAIAASIPADTLRQRPDVRAAEAALVAATERIGVAQARLYPQLSLLGNVGTSALSLGRLGDLVTGGLFASLGQTLFDGGRLRSQVRSQRAAAEGAFAVYKSSVLRALEEVENALVSLQSARVRAAELNVATEAAGNAALLARSQYRTGLTDFRTLLEAERSLLTTRDTAASAKAEEANAAIRLYLAFGGGWQSDQMLQ